MNKMTIIQLLNKISNDEEVPKEFIWDDRKYYLQSDKCYKCDETSTILEEDFIVENLNDEIEIIEEKKIPEKLYKYMEIEEEGCYENILRVYDGAEYEINEDMSFVIDKINSIIDYLKSKGE